MKKAISSSRLTTVILSSMIIVSRIPSIEALLGHSWAVTQFKSVSTNFTWEMQNFDKILQFVHSETIDSPFFHTNIDGLKLSTSFAVQLEGVYKNYVSIRIRCHYNRKTKLIGNVSISIINDKDQQEFEQTKKNFEFITSPEADVTGQLFRDFVPLDDLKRRSAALMPNNVLTIFGEFYSEISVDHITSDCSMTGDSLMPKPNWFDQRFKHFVDKKELSNMVFKIKRHNRVRWTMKAHRILMAAISERLAILMEGRGLNSTLTVSLDDVDRQALVELLRFSYTGTTLELDKHLLDIWHLAERISIKGLYQLCREAICKKVDFENAVDMYHKAKLYSAKPLTERIAKYIVSQLHRFLTRGDVQEMVNEDLMEADVDLLNY